MSYTSKLKLFGILCYVIIEVTRLVDGTKLHSLLRCQTALTWLWRKEICQRFETRMLLQKGFHPNYVAITFAKLSSVSTAAASSLLAHSHAVLVKSSTYLDYWEWKLEDDGKPVGNEANANKGNHKKSMVVRPHAQCCGCFVDSKFSKTITKIV